MTRYARAHARVEVAESSDYRVNFGGLIPDPVDLGNPTKVMQLSPIIANSAYHYVDTAAFTDISALLIVNRGTGQLLAEWGQFTPGASSHVFTQLTFADTNPDTISGIGANYFTKAHGYRSNGYVYLANATDAANNNTAFDYQARTADLITLANAETLTARVADTGVGAAGITIYPRWWDGAFIAAGGHILLGPGVDTVEGFYLENLSGVAVPVDILVIGT